MNTNSAVPSSNEVSGDMVPGCAWVMINDAFYCDFAQELFSLMIAMAWMTFSSRNYDKKLTSAKAPFFVDKSRYYFTFPTQDEQGSSNGNQCQVLISMSLY